MPPTSPQLKPRSTCRAFGILLLLLASVIPAWAQEIGSISGRVSNAATEAYLEGAVVLLEPGNLSALTSTTGEFTFPRVAPGTYTVTVNYTGLEPKSVPVFVEASRPSRLDVQLTSSVYQLDTFVVAGEREGNAAAITSQRNAANVKTVMASDAFGNVADANIGNFIMRMPGVTKSEAEGDVVGIMIRGISDDLSLVTIDGELGASASPLFGMKRGYEVDKISADFIESIEVVKSLTPDLDAGAVGGIVNMKTKSALTRKGRHLTYQLGEGYNVWRETFRPFASVTYSDVFGNDDKLGVLVTMSYHQTNKPRDNSNFTYEATTDTDRPIWFNNGPWGEDWTNHTRNGVSARFDYKLSPETTLYASVGISNFAVVIDRRRGNISTPTPANIVRVTNKTSEARNQTFTYGQNLWERTVRTKNIMVGGESRVFGGLLDYQATYSPSDGWQRQFNMPRIVRNVQLLQDRSITHKYVTITQTGGPDLFDPRNQLLNSLTISEGDITDRVIGSQVNFSRQLETKHPFTLKVGARYREVRKTNDQESENFTYVGPNGVAGPIGAANDDDLARFFDPNYRHRSFLFPNDRMSYFDGEKIKRAMLETPDYFRKNHATGTRNSIVDDAEVSETLSAAYVMGTLRTGRLTTVAGVRFEGTDLEGKGFKSELTPEEVARRAAWVGPLTPEEIVRREIAQYGNPIGAESSYDNFFPSVNFKYEIRPNFLFRAAYYESIGRPAISSIRPTMNVDVENERISANNPDLKPQLARNIDLSLEYYFRSVGLISLGAFRKDLSDFIFSSNVGFPLESGNPFGEEYVGYELRTQRNGGSAWVRGLEFAYQQQLSDFDVPRFIRPFGLFANFTWLSTEGSYTSDGVSDSAAVPGFTPRSGNVGVSWIGHGWTVRVKAKYEGDRLRVYDPNPARRIYVNDHFPIDLNVAYTINRRLTAFIDVINVFDTPTTDDYQYVEDRPQRTFKFSTYIKAGISGRF